MVWEQEEVCNRGIYPGREATSFYCRTSGIALSMREEEFFLSSQRSSHIPKGGSGSCLLHNLPQGRIFFRTVSIKLLKLSFVGYSDKKNLSEKF